jgi:hypothetical protein
MARVEDKPECILKRGISNMSREEELMHNRRTFGKGKVLGV